MRFSLLIWPVILAASLWTAMGCNAPKTGPQTPPLDSTTAGSAEYKLRLQRVLERFRNPQRDLWQRPDIVLEEMGNLEGKTVADIGAGQGYFALPMAALADKVIAVDVDDGFLPYLEQQRIAQDLPNLELRLTQPDSPGLKPAEADIVFMANVYSLIRKRPTYFHKVAQDLKPGGSLWIVDFMAGTDFPEGPPESSKVPPTQVERELREAGFQSFVWDTTSLQYQYILHAR